ncbi:exosortase C-terminal domain/associated protein EpsI [Candidatus Hydrogenedentota bacterium]
MKRYIATIIILLCTTSAYISIQHSHKMAAAETPPADVLDMPSTFGEYVQLGSDADAGESVKKQLETSLILMRTYRARTGRQILLTIVYAGTTRRSLHFPEVCLVGQGWEIREQSTMPVSFLFDASKLSLIRGERNDAVLYWFKTGKLFTGNFFENSWHWACGQLSRGTATSAMIRVSTPVTRDGEEEAFMALADFAAQLTPILADRVK